jgi:hypothetical protein
MKIVEGRVRIAASDVANFLACQVLTQLDLRDWLEERRLDLAERTGVQLPRLAVTEQELRTREDPEVTRIRSALLAGISADYAAGLMAGHQRRHHGSFGKI